MRPCSKKKKVSSIYHLQTTLKDKTTGAVENTLFLTPSSHDDGATLICRARSQVLPTGKDTAVTLILQCECRWSWKDQGGPGLLGLTQQKGDWVGTESSCLTLTDPPVVTLSAEPQTVQEGEKATFLCQATAQPPVTGYRSRNASCL